MTERRPDAPPRRLPRLALVLLAGSIAGLAVLIAAPTWVPQLLRIEHSTADWRTALLSDRRRELHPDVAVVLISEETLADYPYLSPIDRSLLARLISALDEAGAKAIGLDILFLKRTEPEKDEALLATLKSARAEIVLGVLDRRGQLSPGQLDYQKQTVAASGREAGYVNLRIDPDGVVRYRADAASGATDYPDNFAVLLARATRPDAPDTGARIAWLKPPPGERRAFLTVPAEALLADASAHADAAAKEGVRSLAGKTVLVGGDFPYRDQHLTPLAAFRGGETPGVYVHANIVAQIIDARGFAELTLDKVRVLLLGLAAAGCGLGWFLGDRHDYLAGWSFATFILIVVDALVFAGTRTILPFTLGLLAWVLGATCGRNLRTLKSSILEGREA